MLTSELIMSDGVVPYGNRLSICVRRLVSLCLGVIVGVASVFVSVSERYRLRLMLGMVRTSFRRWYPVISWGGVVPTNFGVCAR